MVRDENGEWSEVVIVALRDDIYVHALTSSRIKKRNIAVLRMETIFLW